MFSRMRQEKTTSSAQEPGGVSSALPEQNLTQFVFEDRCESWEREKRDWRRRRLWSGPVGLPLCVHVLNPLWLWRASRIRLGLLSHYLIWQIYRKAQEGFVTSRCPLVGGHEIRYRMSSYTWNTRCRVSSQPETSSVEAVLVKQVLTTELTIYRQDIKVSSSYKASRKKLSRKRNKIMKEKLVCLQYERVSSVELLLYQYLTLTGRLNTDTLLKAVTCPFKRETTQQTVRERLNLILQLIFGW